MYSAVAVKDVLCSTAIMSKDVALSNSEHADLGTPTEEDIGAEYIIWICTNQASLFLNKHAA